MSLFFFYPQQSLLPLQVWQIQCVNCKGRCVVIYLTLYLIVTSYKLFSQGNKRNTLFHSFIPERHSWRFVKYHVSFVCELLLMTNHEVKKLMSHSVYDHGGGSKLLEFSSWSIHDNHHPTTLSKDSAPEIHLHPLTLLSILKDMWWSQEVLQITVRTLHVNVRQSKNFSRSEVTNLYPIT